MNFEWDEVKARENVNKHAVSFVLAQLVFADEFRIEELDNLVSYGEERWKVVGLAKSTLYTVIYTQRGDSFRIISARKATRHEQQDYLQQITP